MNSLQTKKLFMFKKTSILFLKFKDNFPVTPLFYLLITLISSLFYSFITTRFISLNIFSPFLFIFLNAAVDFLIFLDIHFIGLISKHSSSAISRCGFILMFLFLFLGSDPILPVIIALSFFSMLFFSLLSLLYKQEIIKTSSSVKKGLLNLQLLLSLSKLVGFAIGSLIHEMTLTQYIPVLIVSFFAFSFKKIRKEEKKDKTKLRLNGLQAKYYLLLLMMLGATAVFWIPAFIAELSDQGRIELSWLVFIIPGIMSIVFLKLTAKIEVFNMSFKVKNMLHLLFLGAFLVMNIFQVYFWLRVLFLGFIAAINLYIGLDLQAIILKKNETLGMILSLQLIRLASTFALLIFTIISLFDSNFMYYKIMLSLIASTLLLKK